MTVLDIYTMLLLVPDGLIYPVSGCFDTIQYIHVTEYRNGNQKWPIQKNWQDMINKTKKNKTKTQHNMSWTPLYANKHKQRKQ
jgi:hypothetical protein